MSGTKGKKKYSVHHKAKTTICRSKSIIRIRQIMYVEIIRMGILNNYDKFARGTNGKVYSM